MVVLMEGSPISTEELWTSVSDYQVIDHLPDQGPSPLIDQFGQTASSRKSLCGSKLLPFKNDGGHCALGDLQCLVPFPRSVPRHNPVSELYRQFLRPHGMVFALTCTVNMHGQLPNALYNMKKKKKYLGGMQVTCAPPVALLSCHCSCGMCFLASWMSFSSFGVGFLLYSSFIACREGEKEEGRQRHSVRRHWNPK